VKICQLENNTTLIKKRRAIFTSNDTPDFKKKVTSYFNTTTFIFILLPRWNFTPCDKLHQVTALTYNGAASDKTQVTLDVKNYFGLSIFDVK
jgi:hypothetical protein